MHLSRVDLGKLRGLGNKFVGLQKEVVGTVLGNLRLARSGEARQERASEELKATRAEAEVHEAEAEVHEAKAQASEAEEQAAQRAEGQA